MGAEPRLSGQLQDLAFEVIALALEREPVAHAHRMRRFDALAVHVDLAARHRLGRQRARLEMPRAPQPAIDAQRRATTFGALRVFVNCRLGLMRRPV